MLRESSKYYSNVLVYITYKERDREIYMHSLNQKKYKCYHNKNILALTN